MAEQIKDKMEKLVSLCKRRGFIFPSSEIYGGLSSCWDYGPLGVEMKRNIKSAWWQTIVQSRDDVVGLDTSILMHPRVWEASGHITGFSDPLVECKKCNLRWRADELNNIRELDANVNQAVSEFSSTGTKLFVHRLMINAPSGGIELKQALLGSGNLIVKEPLSKEELNKEIRTNFDIKEYALSLNSTLFPGERHYLIGFSLEGGQFSGLMRLVFGDDKGLFQPIELYINFATHEIALGSPRPFCSQCGSLLSEPRQFNLMFKTFMGPVEDQASVVYLRPETAQGIFVNFENVMGSTRKKLPLGIAQQGKSFRNEITTGNFIFRSREFEQMELEFFVKPGTDMDWFDYWTGARLAWYKKLGIKPENLRLAPHPEEDLAHYARCCTDVEYQFPWDWGELEGIANRGDFDLKQHAKFSGKGLSYFDEESKETIVPYVIEPSAGVDRSMLAFLCDAYAEEPDKDEIRIVLHLHPAIAPIKVAVLPLSKKETLAALSQQIYSELRQQWSAAYDDAQSIGRRYRRQDEIGTPYCVTIDFQSLEDKQVTVRERDSMQQIRVPITELKATLAAKLCI